jgi:hypothetical protein
MYVLKKDSITLFSLSLNLFVIAKIAYHQSMTFTDDADDTALSYIKLNECGNEKSFIKASVAF